MSDRRVLLVEDHDEVRFLVRTMLDLGGYDVHEAIDGQAALEIIDTVAPQALVTDLMMPRLDGWQLISRVRGENAYAELPILVMTGADESDPRVYALRVLPLLHIMHKPLKRAELLQVMERMLP
jgi:DNA-binding response OmpR family regulator